MSSPSTCLCGLALRPEWQFCPGCGRTPGKTCGRCDKPLEAAWRHCPFCGEAVAAALVGVVHAAEAAPGPRVAVPAPSDVPAIELVPVSPSGPTPLATPAVAGPTWEPTDLCWALHDALFRAFLKPFGPLFAAVGKADSLSKLMTAREPGLFVNAAAVGLTNVAGQRIYSVWPAAVRSALGRLEGHRRELLALLDPAVAHIRETARAVTDLRLPEGFWDELVHGAGQAATPTTGTGMGAVGGATLGSLLLPGLGTLLGGALGAVIGGDAANQKTRAVLERYDQAWAQLLPGLQSVWDGAWDAVAEAAHQAGCPLPGHPHYDDAEEAWGPLRDRLVAGAAGHADLAGYLDEWGPVPDALRLLFIGCLFEGWGGGAGEARALAERQRRLFPTRPETFECLADLALSGGDAAEALKHAEQGLRIDPESHPLKLARVEALAVLGRAKDAEAAVQAAGEPADQPSPWLSYVRGAARTGDVARVAAAVTAWLATGPVLAHAARLLRTDPFVGPHFAAVAARVADLRPFNRGLGEECAAIVRSLLPADGTKAHHGDLPAAKQAGFAQAFPRLEAGEKLLYFYDWSLWNDAMIGLALTTRRVLWRCMWASPVAVPLAGLDPTDVAADGTFLRVADQRVDLENPHLATLLDAAITELALAVNR